MISVIPKPTDVRLLAGRFQLSPEQLERWQRDGIEAIAALRIINDDELSSEGYELIVSPEAVRINAQTRAGLFYGEQTLRQLVDESRCIPCCIIRDRPRFTWRGMHLDVSRHFFPVEFIKRYLDILAFHKLNVFHWHLTDDQGWRIEIERYPKLTEVGAWRVNREDQPWNEREPERDGESADYGGFYTQGEIAEIVSYAKDRCIEIVPEIEMPAHALAALAAYPELSCAGGPFHVAPGQYWPDTDLFCPGNEESFVFLENVLVEVSELFPGKFIHVGGDEADTREWQRCPKCQKRMRDEGITDFSKLQRYFTNRVAAILRRFGKRLVGWDEILDDHLEASAVVMSWRGVEGGIAAAKKAHDVVMCPASHLYFDHYQNDPATEPEAFQSISPLSNVYSFEPVPPDLDPAEADHILGVQANLWTEYIPTTAHAEYMLLPRLAALSEIAWSSANNRDFRDFSRRLAPLTQRYAALGWNYSRRWK